MYKVLDIKNNFQNNDIIYVEEHLKCTISIAEVINILQNKKYILQIITVVYFIDAEKINELVKTRYIVNNLL